MKFEIVGDPSEPMPDNLEYKVKIPFIGWTLVDEIKYVEAGVSFMDEQRVGPYKLWLQHRRSRGTKMTDEIRYQLPFGFLG